MNTKAPLFVLVVACCGGFPAGCTFPSSRSTVPAAQAGVLNTVEYGSVVSVREVNIEGQRTNLGLAGGGIMGAAATMPSPGAGRGGAIVQAVGAVTGAVVGQSVEELVTRKRAQEITIRLDGGRTVVVIQQSSTGLFMEGDRVRVVHGVGGAQVAMALD
jgi:outer membrane lipoprotein SlyB